jgi:hypothetical protein
MEGEKEKNKNKRLLVDAIVRILEVLFMQETSIDRPRAAEEIARSLPMVSS